MAEGVPGEFFSGFSFMDNSFEDILHTGVVGMAGYLLEAGVEVLGILGGEVVDFLDAEEVEVG